MVAAGRGYPSLFNSLFCEPYPLMQYLQGKANTLWDKGKTNKCHVELRSTAASQC